jgi:glutathione S-transferase
MILPADLLSAVVTLLAIALYFYMSIKVSQMRARHGVKAPATSGHPEFDCAFRVQMNTLEHLPVFLPLLWLATVYFGWAPWAAPLLGMVWIIGRALYMDGYMKAPEKRGPGFGIASVAELLLFVLTLIGVVQNWVMAV